MIPYLPLKENNARFEVEFQQWFDRFLQNGQYILGEAVTHFEQEFASYCGTKHCIGVGNGMDALRLILEGYKVMGKLKPGDQVIVCAHNYIATVLAVKQAGLTPLFIEAEDRYFNIDLNAMEVDLAKAKAIIVTHIYGQIAPMEQIHELAQQKDLLLIEDAAQAHGARYEAKKAGNLGHAAGFSFYPTKNLGALGDAGAITTNDDQLATVVSKLRNYGTSSKYVNEFQGFNSRLDPLQTGFLSIKLKKLDQDNTKRQQIAKNYINRIKNPKLKLPFPGTEAAHVFHIFALRVAQRADFLKFLEKNQIGFLIHYPIPPHKQQALKEYNAHSFPLTERLAEELVSIPLHPALTTQQIETIIATLNRY